MMLKDFMVRTPTTIRPDDSLHFAAQIMAWTEIHHLPVTTGDDDLVGLLTDRDLLAYRAQQPDKDPRATPVAYAMRERPQTATPDSSLSEAATRLAHSNIDCLPVTEEGKLVGLVTRSDLLSAEVRSSMDAHQTSLTVADVMTREPVCVKPDDYVYDAAKLLTQLGIRHLPVIDDDGKAVGMLSDRDVQAVALDPERFVRTIGPEHERAHLVRNAMSRPPLQVRANENCAAVANLFVLTRTSAAVVTAEDGTLEGIISYVDLLRSITGTALSAP